MRIGTQYGLWLCLSVALALFGLPLAVAEDEVPAAPTVPKTPGWMLGVLVITPTVPYAGEELWHQPEPIELPAAVSQPTPMPYPSPPSADAESAPTADGHRRRYEPLFMVNVQQTLEDSWDYNTVWQRVWFVSEDEFLEHSEAKGDRQDQAQSKAGENTKWLLIRDGRYNLCGWIGLSLGNVLRARFYLAVAPATSPQQPGDWGAVASWSTGRQYPDRVVDTALPDHGSVAEPPLQGVDGLANNTGPQLGAWLFDNLLLSAAASNEEATDCGDTAVAAVQPLSVAAEVSEISDVVDATPRTEQPDAAEVSDGAVTQPNVSATSAIWVMAQQRSIQKELLHYFDHPQLGVLLYAAPYTPAAESVADAPIDE